MKIRFNLKTLICVAVLFYPVMLSAVNLFVDQASIWFVRVFLAAFLITDIVVVATKRNPKNFIHLVVIAAIILINVLNFKFQYVNNQDFFGFIFMLLIIDVFCEEDYLEELKRLINEDRVFFASAGLFFGLIFLSVVMGTGLQRTSIYRTSMPILYGPYSLPHSMSYTLIAYYCMASCRYRTTNKKIFLGIMVLCGLCAVWTGVRSGMLSFMVVVLCDFLASKRSMAKIIVSLVVFCGLAGLLLFTDIAINNPIIEKTVNAIGSGSISNGREDFAAIVMNHYFKSTSFSQKFFGISVAGIRKILDVYYAAIHAHNEFVNVLVGMGFVGIIPYVYDLVRFCRKAPMWLLPLLVFGILAYTNGLYMYVSFTPCMPLVILFFRQIYGDKTARVKRKGELFRIGKLVVKR